MIYEIPDFQALVYAFPEITIEFLSSPDSIFQNYYIAIQKIKVVAFLIICCDKNSL